MAQKKYLGFIIAGAVVSASGGSLLGSGFMYGWMGGMFQSLGELMGEMPISFTGMFGVMGIGMVIGGAIALTVGLILLGTGVSKRNAYKASTTPQAGTAASWQPGTSAGREFAYSPSPSYGTISAPVASPQPRATHCRSCGEPLPEGMDVTFCPSCGAPTR